MAWHQPNTKGSPMHARSATCASRRSAPTYRRTNSTSTSPHLMLRYRAVELREHAVPWQQRQLVESDRNGRLAGAAAPLANWASDRGNRLTRPLMEKVVGVDRRAA